MVNASVLFIITARGGSKGVPRKNIREIAGLPLVAYKIRAAQRCECKHKRIIVSTDDIEIAKVSKQYGGEVPFMRPEYLAMDNSSSMDVIEHALNWIEQSDNEKYDYVVMLEPSSPFARPEDLDKALNIIIDNNADTLLGMKEVEVNTCFIHTLDEKNGLSLFYESIKNMKDVRRQAQKTEYTMNGCMYISKYKYFRDKKLFHSTNSVPYVMPEELSIEIDSMMSYEVACALVDKGYIDTRPWN